MRKLIALGHTFGYHEFQPSEQLLMFQLLITKPDKRFERYLIPQPMVPTDLKDLGRYESLDKAEHAAICPSLDLAATVLHELGEAVAPDRLASLADSGAEAATLQRLGWMLDHAGWGKKTGDLADALDKRNLAWRKLRTDSPARGPRDNRWRVIMNETVEADL